MKLLTKHQYETIKEPVRKTQEKWIEYFNKKKCSMISAPDFYEIAKRDNKTMIDFLKACLRIRWETTSTQIIYNQNNLKADILHNAGSKYTKIINYYNVKIPIFEGKFKKNMETEEYLQPLFNTNDSLVKILNILKKFDTHKKLQLWTPDRLSRSYKSIKERTRAVEFSFNGCSKFSIYASSWFINNAGLSHGIVK